MKHARDRANSSVREALRTSFASHRSDWQFQLAPATLSCKLVLDVIGRDSGAYIKVQAAWWASVVRLRHHKWESPLSPLNLFCRPFRPGIWPICGRNMR